MVKKNKVGYGCFRTWIDVIFLPVQDMKYGYPYLEKYPLDRIYQDWLKSDVSYMGMIRDTIDDSAKDAVKERREKQRESR